MEETKSLKTPLLEKTQDPKPPAPQLTQYPEVVQNPQQGIIACAGCRTQLYYPLGCYCVNCPNCHTLTAVQSISRIMCPCCGASLIYPYCAMTIRCYCGQILLAHP